ncbi:MAG TPA: ABC transporter permease [Cyclobacteriaceae bacterium]|nr:ABC transporter permease [Cyclobacteriaceae bacterium]
MSAPPKILSWLLDRLTPKSRQDLKGDFLELYEVRKTTRGRLHADGKLLRDLITIIPFRFIVKQQHRPPAYMFSTNLKIARRTLLKNKLNSVLNLTGLSVSIAACILIALFVRDELSYDKHFADHERIFRIAGNYRHGGPSISQNAATTYMLLPMLEGNLPGVDLITRIEPRWEIIRLDKDHEFRESHVLYADSTFFDMFTIPLVSGNVETALDDPSSVVIDKSTAQKYFGGETAIGKFIELNDKVFKVSAVMENIPANTHFQANIIFPISGVKQWYDPWVSQNPSGVSLYTYIKAGHGFNANSVTAGIDTIFAKHWPETQPPTFFLQPIDSIHLESNITAEIGVNGSKTTVYVFAATALIILILACINYINLSIASALQRFKEVGMKRILGSTSRSQVFQFQIESFMIAGAGAILAIIIAALTIPFFNHVSGKSLGISLGDWQIASGLLTLIFLLGAVAGTFPAFMLLRLKTASMLDGKVPVKGSRSPFRNGLIVFQFSISIALITSTLIIVSQMNFIRDKDLGMTKENIVIIPIEREDEDPGKVAAWFETARTEFFRNASILDVAASTVKVTNPVAGWRPYQVTWQKDYVTVPTTNVSADFFDAMGVTFVAGRNFSRKFPSDARGAYIINESAAQFLKLDNAVGASLDGATFTGKDWFEKHAKIVGVVKDIQFGSLHQPAQPLVFNLASEITDPLRWIEVRIASRDIGATMTFLESVWQKISPEKTFQYEFMDQSLALNYEAEQRLLQLFVAFSILSIVIGCLGLFGLTAFMTRRRTKEIGIRKVVGASIPRLLGLLSKDFLALVVISNLIGWPAAYFFMSKWLQDFAYKTEISIWQFIITGGAALTIAFAAILFHALQASRANPVNALKYE